MNFNATFIGQIIAFAGFVLFCAKIVWPPIMAAMKERQQKIAAGLDSADRATRDLEMAKDQIAKELLQAKEDSAKILDQANRRAAQLVADAKQEAQDEGQRLIAAAKAEVDKEVTIAREQLRSRIAELTLKGAEKILAAEIDASKHNKLLDQLVSEL